ncbi:MAG: SDR family oxidoreductase [Candidatus Omnitrophica bacterium]|nr:SDR family oxidoreductase [Candidatus Omnitrophota bacterium]
MNRPLAGKNALITGASRGIGRAIALELAAAGANIAVNYVRDEDAAKKTASELESLGVRTLIYQANVGDPQALAPLADAAVQAFGGIDILVHNAAMGAFKPVHKLKANQWDLSMDINAKAFLLLVQKVLPSMESRGGGSVVALSSLGAGQFIPNYGAIGISKAALESLVRYLAVELCGRKIRVNAVSGGLVETDALKFFPEYNSFKDEVIRRTPAGRIARPEDLARVVKFLVSPESEWIVGQTLIADGGLSLI